MPQTMAARRPKQLLSCCLDQAQQTTLYTRVPSTRQYSTVRQQGESFFFFTWCRDQGNPVCCSVLAKLEFRHSLLGKGRSASTLKVYVAAISCHHAGVDGGTVGNHRLTSLFLRGVWRFSPPRIPRAPAWDFMEFTLAESKEKE